MFSSLSVLLFDEPLSNLDAKLRADMRIELRELQHRLGITSVYVTHDLEEALAMSDRIVVMRDGLIEQTGTPDEIYRLPNSAFVADFVGSANLIRGRHRRRSRRGRADRAGNHPPGSTSVYTPWPMGAPVGAELVVSVRTVHLKLSTEPPAAAQNVWRVPVEQTVFQGDFTQVHVGWGGQQSDRRAARGWSRWQWGKMSTLASSRAMWWCWGHSGSLVALRGCPMIYCQYTLGMRVICGHAGKPGPFRRPDVRSDLKSKTPTKRRSRGKPRLRMAR